MKIIFMDLIRLLLLDIEGEEKADLSNYTEEKVKYHTDLLIKAELVDGKPRTIQSGKTFIESSISGLTWKGHDFLDDARNETVWKRVKKAVAEKGETASLAVIQAVLIKFAMNFFLTGLNE